MASSPNKKDAWDAELYDVKHSFVSKYGNDLIELLAPKQGENILDLGCGTGDLANTLYESGVDVVGVDKSENMVKQAISKYPHIPFMVQDATWSFKANLMRCFLTQPSTGSNQPEGPYIVFIKV